MSPHHVLTLMSRRSRRLTRRIATVLALSALVGSGLVVGAPAPAQAAEPELAVSRATIEGLSVKVIVRTGNGSYAETDICGDPNGVVNDNDASGCIRFGYATDEQKYEAKVTALESGYIGGHRVVEGSALAFDSAPIVDYPTPPVVWPGTYSETVYVAGTLSAFRYGRRTAPDKSPFIWVSMPTTANTVHNGATTRTIVQNEVSVGEWQAATEMIDKIRAARTQQRLMAANGKGENLGYSVAGLMGTFGAVDRYIGATSTDGYVRRLARAGAAVVFLAGVTTAYFFSIGRRGAHSLMQDRIAEATIIWESRLGRTILSGDKI